MKLTNALLLLLALAPAATAQDFTCTDDLTKKDGKDLLDQGWTCQTMWKFWYTGQGSEIMPYEWFKALRLEVKDKGLVTLTQRALDRGYIAAPQAPDGVTWPVDLNPDGLPIGFTKDKTKDQTQAYIGMSCAACHTARIVLPSVSVNGHQTSQKTVIVNGGPSNADFFGFLEDMAEALRQTDSARLVQFKNAIETSSYKLSEDELHTELASLLDRIERNRPVTAYGRGRVDAFGHIFNMVVDYGKRWPANAPVSYPSLWLTPQQDHVQWNAIASNHGKGPLLRNVGEALGVFGRFSTEPGDHGYGYWSSLDIDNLNKLEEWVKQLQPPSLPLEYRDPKSAKPGEDLYRKNCAFCHALAFAQRSGLSDDIVAKPVRWVSGSGLESAETIATDGYMLSEFLGRALAFGKLASPPVDRNLSYLRTVAGNVTQGDSALGQVVLGTAIVNTFVGKLSLFDAIFQVNPANARALTQDLLNTRSQYKAGPLNGIWATGSYLHNGSVRSLQELLSANRTKKGDKFCLERGPFDPVNVGFIEPAGCTQDLMIGEPNQGNSNLGHNFGTKLSPEEKTQLIEYLKTL